MRTSGLFEREADRAAYEGDIAARSARRFGRRFSAP